MEWSCINSADDRLMLCSGLMSPGGFLWANQPISKAPIGMRLKHWNGTCDTLLLACTLEWNL